MQWRNLASPTSISSGRQNFDPVHPFVKSRNAVQLLPLRTYWSQAMCPENQMAHFGAPTFSTSNLQLLLPPSFASMTPEETARMTILVHQIAVEKDRDIFLKLITELNELLSHKKERLAKSPPTSPAQD